MDSEKSLKQAVGAAQSRFGPHHLAVGAALSDLAEFYIRHNKHLEANACDRRIRQILETWLAEHKIPEQKAPEPVKVRKDLP
jgi:hypothetical protein